MKNAFPATAASMMDVLRARKFQSAYPFQLRCNADTGSDCDRVVDLQVCAGCGESVLGDF